MVRSILRLDELLRKVRTRRTGRDVSPLRMAVAIAECITRWEKAFVFASQIRQALLVLGDVRLADLLQEASLKIRRDIIFTSSLYIH